MTQRIHISKVSTDSLIDYDLLYSVSPNPSLNYDVNMQITTHLRPYLFEIWLSRPRPSHRSNELAALGHTCDRDAQATTQIWVGQG